MPWKVETTMSRRQDFVAAMAQDHWAMQELCARFGISRKTGYKWWTRFVHGGLPALGDHSRRPLTLPTQLTGAVAALCVRARQAHPTWGPRKLLAYLARPANSAASTRFAGSTTRSGRTRAWARSRRRPTTGPPRGPMPTRCGSSSTPGTTRPAT